MNMEIYRRRASSLHRRQEARRGRTRRPPGLTPLDALPLTMPNLSNKVWSEMTKIAVDTKHSTCEAVRGVNVVPIQIVTDPDLDPEFLVG